MQLSEHFSIDEFTASETAARLEIRNTLPQELLPVAQQTCAMLERVRMLLGRLSRRDVPIFITSGYRCLDLNRKIGSADTSDHLRAQAADIKVAGWSALDVCRALVPCIDELGIGQMIYEYRSWTHLSTRTPTNHLNRVLTIDPLHPRGRAGVHP